MINQKGQVFTVEALLAVGIILVATILAVEHPFSVADYSLERHILAKDVITILCIDNKYGQTYISYWISQNLHKPSTQAGLTNLLKSIEDSMQGYRLGLKIYRLTPSKKLLYSYGVKDGACEKVVVAVGGALYEVVVYVS